MMGIFWGALAFVVLAACFYWLFIITEGTYLGPRMVTWLYDLYAGRYDKTKDLSFIYEARFIGLPLAEALGPLPSPRVLDVAAGTGRVAIALLRECGFRGLVVGLDRSQWMLAEARATFAALEKCDPDGARVDLLRGDAAGLPFGASTFECITCLESLEFMRSGQAVLREMVRVLKPGGLLLLSNRVGSDAWFFPGRLCGRGRLEDALRDLGLQDVTNQLWQVHYDLVWACKR